MYGVNKKNRDRHTDNMAPGLGGMGKGGRSSDRKGTKVARRRVRLILLAAAALAPLPTTVAGAVSPPAAEPEPALLERLEQLRQVGQRAGQAVWPGWDTTATPLAIYKRNELGVLVGHPSPPSHFRRLPAPMVSAPVFVADTTAGMVLVNATQPFAGVLTTFVSHQDFAGKTVVETLATVLHELFHAHQQRIAPDKSSDLRVVLWGEYPEFSADNRALLLLEAQLLHEAATATDPQEARRSAAGFLGMRAERRKKLTPAVARYESREESSEGLALYVQLRLLQLLPRLVEDAAAGPSQASQSPLPAAQADSVSQQALQSSEKWLEPLLHIHRLGRDRERFYALGMAQALLLDRFRPGWKKEFETGPQLLDQLLAISVPSASPAETARLMKRLRFRRVLKEQELALARRHEQGTRRLAALMTDTGERVVVEVGAAKEKATLRGFNANGTVAVGPGLVVHTLLLLDLGAEPGPRMRLEFRGLPVVYEQEHEVLWFVLPREAITKALEDYTSALSTGPARLVLRAKRFVGEFTGVQVERRGRELRIRPAEDLRRAPPLKPPKFVRPGNKP